MSKWYFKWLMAVDSSAGICTKYSGLYLPLLGWIRFRISSA